MNKRVLVTLLLTAMFGKISADCNSCEPCKTLCPTTGCRQKATSKTFFTVNPEFQAGLPERTTLWRHDRVSAREGGNYGTIQLVPFGGRSTRASDLAAYFSIDYKSVLNVSENTGAANNLPNPNIDILSQHFNIYTNQGIGGNPLTPGFESQICFEPRRYIAGLGVSYRQGFDRREDGKGFFFEMSFPIEQVETSMHLGETVLSNGGGAVECATLTNSQDVSSLQCPLQSAVGANGAAYQPVDSMCAAFQQPAWKYGRIENGTSHNKKSGVGDIDLLIGYDIINTEACYFSSHLGVLAATGNTPKGILMFEPIVGFNNTTALRYGGEFGVDLWRHPTKDRSMWFYFQSEFFFHLNKVQTRSFDLKGKQWSRYMQVYESFEQSAQAFFTGNAFLHTPGINVFTQDVNVKAGVSRTYQSGLTFNNKGFQGELGYSYCARPAECVELQCSFPQGIVLKSLDEAGAINTIQTINNPVSCKNILPEQYSPVELYNEYAITSANLDMNSAAHPAFESYIIYASLGNRWDDRDYPLFIGGGGSYQFSKDNSTMTSWLLWGKVGFSF